MAKLKYSEKFEDWVLETEEHVIRIGKGRLVPERFDGAEVDPSEKDIGAYTVKVKLEGKEEMIDGLADIELQTEKAMKAVGKLNLALENL